jgi:ubiquinone/menaquinone biosynthesis C-methylase UbiE
MAHTFPPTPESSGEAELSDRQQREIEYHRDRAATHAHFATERVDLSAVTSAHYRWWNAYWVILRKAKNLDITGKNVLVVGCGFGDDAIQLAHLGASIKAIDISAESVAIARQRAAASDALVDFEVSPAEKLPFADETFDLVYLPDVVHHLDISAAMREVRRVLKPRGVVLGNEPYTHSWLELIRQSRVVREFIYPRMVKRIYGTENPYITVDERKLDQRDLRQIGRALQIAEKQYFLLVSGRLATSTFQAIIDRLILMIPFIGHFLAGRVVFYARRGS